MKWLENLLEGASRLLDIYPAPRRRIEFPTRTKTCKECKRTYRTVDEAAICSDWDKVLGNNRHSWK